MSAAPTLTLPHRGRELIGCKNSNSFITIHMQYGSSYLNLPQNGSLPRGGGLGWGQEYKFQKMYAFAWFGKRSSNTHKVLYKVCRIAIGVRGENTHKKPAWRRVS